MPIEQVKREELGLVAEAFDRYGHGNKPLVLVVQLEIDPLSQDTTMVVTFHPAYTSPENRARLVELTKQVVIQLQELLDAEEKKH